jgi:hypothetical protein
MSDETMGEVAEKVEALGTYNHVGPDGTVWRLTYVGSVQLTTDGWLPFPPEELS